MINKERLKQNTFKLIHAISRLACNEQGKLQKITMNFDGLAIVEFTTKEGITSPELIVDTLAQSKMGPVGALECLNDVTIQMVVDIDDEQADVGIDLTFSDVSRPTLLYVDSPKLEFSFAQHSVLFRLYDTLHSQRTEVPVPKENPGRDTVYLLRSLLQEVSAQETMEPESRMN